MTATVGMSSSVTDRISIAEGYESFGDLWWLRWVLAGCPDRAVASRFQPGVIVIWSGPPGIGCPPGPYDVLRPLASKMVTPMVSTPVGLRKNGGP
jgi:hypothetical protein